MFAYYALVGWSKMSYKDIGNIPMFQRDLRALISFGQELWLCA